MLEHQLKDFHAYVLRVRRKTLANFISSADFRFSLPQGNPQSVTVFFYHCHQFLVRQQGAYVTGITEKDVKDIYMIRSLLEGLCARWATEHITHRL